jgi:hypothetical protein
VPGAIGWHFDGPYATETVQLSLNDDTEYEGGRLCYYTKEKGVEVLSRQAGDITKHGTASLHAVTRVSAGTRYSLFVVDASNGLGDNLVIEPTIELVEMVLSLIQEERTPTPATVPACADAKPSSLTTGQLLGGALVVVITSVFLSVSIAVRWKEA